MTQTMLERAARAMVEANDEEYPFFLPYVDADNLRDTILDGHFDAISMARAVLMAVREPDDAMVESGYGAPQVMDEPARPDHIFTAMIDAILNETPE